jgi:hypothetical protein
MMEYAIGYVAVLVIIQAFAAVRTPSQDCQVVIFASVFWPLMFVIIAVDFALEALGWKFDVVKGSKLFGFRKPTNPKAVGYALTIFKLEIQLYKVKA